MSLTFLSITIFILPLSTLLYRYFHPWPLHHLGTVLQWSGVENTQRQQEHGSLLADVPPKLMPG
jgi:hypothetical protein